jgi:hypothetical protein
MHRDKIHKLAVKLSQNVPGSAAYLSSYSRARRKVEEKLTENQRQSYRVMAKDWSDKQLPPSEQQRYAYRNGSST